VFEGGGFDVLLVAAGDLAGVAVGVEVLEVRGDGGVVGGDGCVEGGVVFGDLCGEGLRDGMEAVVMVLVFSCFQVVLRVISFFLRCCRYGLVFATWESGENIPLESEYAGTRLVDNFFFMG